MDSNKSQIIVLDKSQLATVAEALSSGWTIEENLDTSSCIESEVLDTSVSSPTYSRNSEIEITEKSISLTVKKTKFSSSLNYSNEPSETKKQSINKLEIKQISEKTKSPQYPRRDNSHVATLTQLGHKLSQAAKRGDITAVTGLLGVGAPFTSEVPIGNNPLHLAAQNGHFETCELLLRAGITRDLSNKVDKTALHLAATEGHSDIVKLLLKNSANINALDMLQMTPLHWACDRGHVDVVETLLKYNADTETLNKFKQSPIQLALLKEHDLIVSMIQDGLDCEEDLVLFENPDDSDNLEGVPQACKTEEVSTEESYLAKTVEMIKSDYSGYTDVDEASKSVLATLAELAKSTPEIKQESTLEMSTSDALELLKAQATLLPADDSSALITNAIAHGQTIQLTEAGQQALRIIKQESIILPTSSTSISVLDEIEEQNNVPRKRKHSEADCPSIESIIIAPLTSHIVDCSDLEQEIQEDEQLTEVITVTPEQYAALTDGTSNELILQVVSDGKTEMIVADTSCDGVSSSKLRNS